jgi:UDP-N-acetylglucosamine 1-carboxyvinyltransferase
MGAKIDGQGSPTIVIEGVDSLSPADFEVMPDRIVAATYLFATATTGGEVTVRDMIPEHLARVLEVLADADMTIDAYDDRVHIVADRRPKAVDVSTLPYPGFLTDLQPMAMAMATVADGMSIITENIYDNRFFHVDELARMGADIRVEKHYAAVRGVDELSGAEVRAADVSAGAALVIAGLAAKGRTRVEDIIHIDRRYERLEDALTSLGARMERVEGRGEPVAAPPRPPA